MSKDDDGIGISSRECSPEVHEYILSVSLTGNDNELPMNTGGNFLREYSNDCPYTIVRSDNHTSQIR